MQVAKTLASIALAGTFAIGGCAEAQMPVDKRASLPANEFRYAMSSGEMFVFWVHDKQVTLILSGTDLVFDGDECSDQQFHCADMTFGVAAVPRTNVASGAAWQAHGWSFQAQQQVSTSWGQGWVISGKQGDTTEEFTYVPTVGVVDLRLLTSDRPGWQSSTPITLRTARGVLADN
jgi:hypothetical protein